ncbi:hypothetical protein ABZP36_033897 [Zizania latifolia]
MLDIEITDKEVMPVLEKLSILAAHCLSPRGDDRPTMKEVAECLQMLRRLPMHAASDHKGGSCAHDNNEGSSSVAVPFYETMYESIETSKILCITQSIRTQKQSYLKACAGLLPLRLQPQWLELERPPPDHAAAHWSRHIKPAPRFAPPIQTASGGTLTPPPPPLRQISRPPDRQAEVLQRCPPSRREPPTFAAAWRWRHRGNRRPPRRVAQSPQPHSSSAVRRLRAAERGIGGRELLWAHSCFTMVLRFLTRSYGFQTTTQKKNTGQAKANFFGIKHHQEHTLTNKTWRRKTTSMPMEPTPTPTNSELRLHQAKQGGAALGRVAWGGEGLRLAERRGWHGERMSGNGRSGIMASMPTPTWAARGGVRTKGIGRHRTTQRQPGQSGTTPGGRDGAGQGGVG